MYVTPLRRFEVPEVLEIHMVVSDEVRMVPLSPTVTKVLFAYLTFQRLFDVPEVLEIQVVASEEVRMVPELPTVTKVLFA